LDKADDMETDLRSRVVSLEHQGQGHGRRLDDLEKWQRQSDLIDARKEGEWKAMSDKIDTVGKKVDKISSDLSRVVWLILAGLIMAAVAFIVKGGFAT
jgi:hypothetical protein